MISIIVSTIKVKKDSRKIIFNLKIKTEQKPIKINFKATGPRDFQFRDSYYSNCHYFDRLLHCYCLISRSINSSYLESFFLKEIKNIAAFLSFQEFSVSQIIFFLS